MRGRSKYGTDFLFQYQLQLAGLFGCSHLKTLLELWDDTDGKREEWGHWALTQTPSEWGKSAAASASDKKGRRDARDPKVSFSSNQVLLILVLTRVCHADMASSYVLLFVTAKLFKQIPTANM